MATKFSHIPVGSVAKQPNIIVYIEIFQSSLLIIL